MAKATVSELNTILTSLRASAVNGSITSSSEQLDTPSTTCSELATPVIETPVSPGGGKRAVVGEQCDEKEGDTRYFAKVVDVQPDGQVQIDFGTIVTSKMMALDTTVDAPLHAALVQFIKSQTSTIAKPPDKPEKPAKPAKKSDAPTKLDQLDTQQVTALLKQWRLYKFFGDRFVPCVQTFLTIMRVVNLATYPWCGADSPKTRSMETCSLYVNPTTSKRRTSRTRASTTGETCSELVED